MTKRLFLTLFLIFTVAVAGIAFLFSGPSAIFQDFKDSEIMMAQKHSFMEGMENYVLNPIDFDKVKQDLTVTQAEIDYYREYYGSLSAQLNNVRSQYESVLNDEGLAEEERAIYEKERDMKLEEIRKNFESNDVVKEKILAIKKQAVERFEKAYNAEKKDFEKNYSSFGYQLTDQSGKTYSSDIKGAVWDKISYKEGEEWYVEGDRYLPLYDYTSGEPGIEHSEIHVSSPSLSLVGQVVVSDSILQQTYIKEEMRAYTFQRGVLYLAGGAAILAIILLTTVLKPKRHVFDALPNVEKWFVKLPMDFRLAFPIVSGFLTFIFLESMPYRFYQMGYWLNADNRVVLFFEEILLYLFIFACMSTAILTGIWVYDAIKKEGLHEENSVIIRLGMAIKESFLNKTIGKQTMAMFIVFFLGGIGFAVVLIEPAAILIYTPLVLFILLPVMYMYFKRMGYLNRVMKQTEDMAAGRLASVVEVKGKSPIAHHAENLNDLRKGIELSMKEQAKSERLKTELITNVSHDLRTPLTSIITYTDLLKNPDLTEEERAKYVGILDQKSAKLKTLIEDLFDVSKMASGNIEIVKRRVDLAQMLQQAAGEHEEDFTAAGLDLRVAIHDQPIYAEVDGQKWWRVVDNLLLNARKYSLEGTRVYVSLQTVSGMAEFSVKNVAKYELGENVEELTERFKRADTSRHTEGSGLGLAIAQSIVDLHGAQMKIEVDGDLFKVIVKIHTV